MAVIKQQITNEEIDTNTGEIIKRKENLVKSYCNEPPYIKLYLHDILYLSDLPKTHDKILLSLLKKSTWANSEYGMIVTLSAGMKRIMANELDFKNVRTINNALSDFVKADILKRLETGVYQLNPYLFGRGDWQDIENLRMMVNYTLEGRTFKSMIEYKNRLEQDLREMSIKGDKCESHGTTEESGTESEPV